MIFTSYINYACVVYPGSVPENWIDILSSYHVPAFISPLHDKDISLFDGNLYVKKPHYHVFVMFSPGDEINVPYIQDFFSSFDGIGFMAIRSSKGYARCLCHLNNPEKHQYNPDDVICLNGADYYKVAEVI